MSYTDTMHIMNRGGNPDTETTNKELEEIVHIKGMFIPPPMTAGSTITILEEVAQIWKKMGNGEVNIVIIQEDF